MRIDSWHHITDISGGQLGGYSQTPAYLRAGGDVQAAIAAVTWPVGAADFTIYPESGKKSGKGNGVRPIKEGFTRELVMRGWTLEHRAPKSPTAKASVKGALPGAFDCHLDFDDGVTAPFVVEWETGNISSSHRAINRMALGILRGYVGGGLLVVPTARLSRFLTDRVGNERELAPYHDLWRNWRFQGDAYFGIVAVEHDAESWDVPQIPKGTDGRALL